MKKTGLDRMNYVHPFADLKGGEIKSSSFFQNIQKYYKDVSSSA